MAKKKQIDEQEQKRIEREEIDNNKSLGKRKAKLAKDVSSSFKWNAYDAAVADILIDHEKNSPEKLMKLFEQYHERLSDFAFWYLLRVCWLRFPSEVHSDLWGKFFTSNRTKKNKSIMRPSEATKLRLLPKKIPIVYSKKQKWVISYNIVGDDDCLDLVKSPVEFGEVSKNNVVALFHGKKEILEIDEDGAPIFGKQITPDELIILNPEHITILASDERR